MAETMEHMAALLARIEELEQRLARLEGRVDESERHMVRAELERHMVPRSLPVRSPLAHDTVGHSGEDGGSSHAVPHISWLP